MYAKFHTDPSITDETLTPKVLEEIGRLKAEIINAVLPHWTRLTGDDDIDVLALELEPDAGLHPCAGQGAEGSGVALRTP
jgi:hypothetical protein